GQRRSSTYPQALLVNLPRRGLCHGNDQRIESGAGADQVSRRCNGVYPLRCRFGSEDPQRRPGDEMALIVERVVDGSVHAEEALGGCSRLEPLHLALSPTHDLVGVLGPIIFAEPLVVMTGQTEFSERVA